MPRLAGIPRTRKPEAEPARALRLHHVEVLRQHTEPPQAAEVAHSARRLPASRRPRRPSRPTSASSRRGDRRDVPENARPEGIPARGRRGMFALADDSGLEVPALEGRSPASTRRATRGGRRRSREQPQARRGGARGGSCAPRRDSSACSRSRPPAAVLRGAEGVSEGVLIEEPRGRGGSATTRTSSSPTRPDVRGTAALGEERDQPPPRAVPPAPGAIAPFVAGKPVGGSGCGCIGCTDRLPRKPLFQLHQVGWRTAWGSISSRDEADAVGSCD